MANQEFQKAHRDFCHQSNAYGTPSGTAERWIGNWLGEYDREEIVIASKVYFDVETGYPDRGGLTRKDIRHHIRGTLDRLGTEYLDIYYIHRWDEETPILQTLRTLTDLVREGRVHYLGASTMAAWQLTKALWKSESHDLKRFELTQPQYNAAYRDEVEAYLEVCADQSLAVCPYSPLQRGLLTGKYERDSESPDGSRGDLIAWDPKERFSERQWRVLDAVREVANDLDATPAQVALRWLIDREAFTCVPIIGARTVPQLTENCGATDVSLTGDHRQRITEAYTD